MSRTIKNLTELNGVVYVYLSDSATGKRFLEDAEKEGFTFGDGAKPTSRDYAMVMAVHPDNTLNYVGAVGNAAFDMADKIGFAMSDIEDAINIVLIMQPISPEKTIIIIVNRYIIHSHVWLAMDFFIEKIIQKVLTK